MEVILKALCLQHFLPFSFFLIMRKWSCSHVHCKCLQPEHILTCVLFLTLFFPMPTEVYMPWFFLSLLILIQISFEEKRTPNKVSVGGNGSVGLISSCEKLHIVDTAPKHAEYLSEKDDHSSFLIKCCLKISWGPAIAK